jgi:hypothetical protein
MIGLCPGSVDVLVLCCLIIVSVANIGLVDVLAVELSRDFTLQHHSQALSNLFSPNEDTNPFTNTIKVSHNTFGLIVSLEVCGFCALLRHWVEGVEETSAEEFQF